MKTKGSHAKSQLYLDHFFCFTTTQVPELSLLEKEGFTFSPEVLHRGQGTGNRSMIFEENYFELIYMNSKEDALNNPLQIWRRAEWEKTGACPFGIGLRGTLSEADRTQFWEYRPPYFPGRSILIHERNETDPTYPLLFVMETPAGQSLESMKPAQWNKDEKFQARLRHRTGTKQIVAAEIRCTSKEAWPLSAPVPHVSIASRCAQFACALKLDGTLAKAEIQVNALLQLLS